jgi:hypothetical protein
MAQINPHDAGSACGIESVVNGCVDPLVDCYPQLIAQSLDDLHPEICPRQPDKEPGCDGKPGSTPQLQMYQRK